MKDALRSLCYATAKPMRMYCGACDARAKVRVYMNEAMHLKTFPDARIHCMYEVEERLKLR